MTSDETNDIMPYLRGMIFGYRDRFGIRTGLGKVDVEVPFFILVEAADEIARLRDEVKRLKAVMGIGPSDTMLAETHHAEDATCSD